MPEADQSKKVALFLPSMAGGGAERVVLAEARELVRRRHKVDLILSLGGGELLPLLPPEVRVIDIGASRMIGALLPLVRYLRREHPDALHAAMWPATIIAILAHRLARSYSRLVVSDHTVLSQHVTGKAAVALRWTTRLLYPLADARTQCSALAADDLARLAHLDRASIEVVRSPIEPPARITTTPQIEASWSGPRGARILTVGSLKPEKNHALLLRAFAAIDRPDARLMIVGEGGLRPRIEALALQLGIADRVILPGFDLDPWPYYGSADLFVLSSDYEGFGLVLAEAMAAGLQIVSTECGDGPAELLDGGRFGRIVPCKDSAALAIAMQAALLETPQPAESRKHALSRAGQQQIARLVDLATA